MNFLMIIPGLFEVLEKIVGPLFTSEAKGSIISKVMGLGSSAGVDGIMEVIKGTFGQIENEKLMEIKAQVSTLLAQADIDKNAPEGLFNKGWRPSLAWGLTIIILFHLGFCEFLNVIAAFNIYTPGTIAPLNTITVSLIFGLLGLYMSARTVEKVNSNQDNDN